MRSFAKMSLGLVLTILAVLGCGTNQALPTTATATLTPSETASPPNQTQELQVLLANSRNLVGENRFPVGVIRDGKSVQNAQVQLKFFDINGNDPVLKNESDAPFYGDNLGAAGVYVGRATFDMPGQWGVEATVTEEGFPTEAKRIALTVLEKDPSPAVGTQAEPIAHLMERARRKIFPRYPLWVTTFEVLQAHGVDEAIWRSNEGATGLQGLPCFE